MLYPLRLGADKSSEWPPKYCKLELELADGTHMAFADSRRFARIRWLVDPRSMEPLSRLACDAFTSLPALAEFKAVLRSRYGGRKSLKIKTLLLDQASTCTCFFIMFAVSSDDMSCIIY